MPRNLAILAVICLIRIVHAQLMEVGVAKSRKLRGGAEVIKPAEFVWFVEIWYDSTFQCNGSLIGAKYVLTVSSCVHNANDGDHDITVKVDSRCQHGNNCGPFKDFVMGIEQGVVSEEGSVVVLELKRPVKFWVLPAIPYLGKKYHPEQLALKKGRRMTMVGVLGSTNEDDKEASSSLPFAVQKLEVKSMSRKRCKRTVNEPSFVKNHIVCSAVKKNPCAVTGDAVGSPLLVPGQGRFQGRDVILAIHNSQSPSNCSKDQALLHFRMQDAANLIMAVVCQGYYPEDWCEGLPGVPSPQLKATFLHDLEEHSNYVYSVAFNSDGTRLVSGSRDGTLKVWDPLNGGASIATLPAQSQSVRSVKWNPVDHNVLATGGANGQVKLWNLQRPTEPTVTDLLPRHDSKGFRSLAWHPDGVMLASSGYEDETVWIWNTQTNEVVQTFSTPDIAYGVAFHPNGTQLAVGLFEGTMIWTQSKKNDSYELLRTLEARDEEITWSVAYSANGKFLASANMDDFVRVWDAETGKLRHEFSHDNDAYSVDWSPDGKYLSSGGEDRSAFVWDPLNGGEPLVKLQRIHGRVIWTVDWSPDGVHLASAGDDTIKIWKIESE